MEKDMEDGLINIRDGRGNVSQVPFKVTDKVNFDLVQKTSV
jgi:hypothetical protein